MRKFLLKAQDKNSVSLNGSFGNVGTVSVALPPGAWSTGVMTIGQGSNSKGVVIHFGTDSTKTQSFEVGSYSSSIIYNNFYSKIQGHATLCGSAIFTGSGLIQTCYIKTDVSPWVVYWSFTANSSGQYLIKVNR